MPYAERTEVPVHRTKAEIETLVVTRHGADAYLTAHQGNPPRAVIQFKMQNRIIRFELPLPQDPSARGYEQALRSRWRALLLVIKAKLEAVERGVSEFEEEFLANIVMPNDQTVAQYAIPQVAAAYKSGQMPARLMLPGGTE